MKKLINTLALFLVLALGGCESRTTFSGAILGSPQFGDCHSLIKDMNGNVLRKGEVIIRNQDEYETLRKMFLNSKRDSSECIMPLVDFSKVSILGKSAPMKGDDFRFDKKVTIDKQSKRYVFSIRVKSFDSDGGDVLYMHYVYVPAIPKDYEVIFEVD